MCFCFFKLEHFDEIQIKASAWKVSSHAIEMRIKDMPLISIAISRRETWQTVQLAQTTKFKMKYIAGIVVILVICYTLDAASPICFCPLCTCGTSSPSTGNCNQTQAPLEDPASGTACEDYCHNTCLEQCASTPGTGTFMPGCHCSCPCRPVPCPLCAGSEPSGSAIEESAIQQPAVETNNDIACQCKFVCPNPAVACTCPPCQSPPGGPL